MSSKQDERVIRLLRSENLTLKRTISRLRKKLGKFEPIEEEPEEQEIVKEKNAMVCPNCSGELSALVTPNKSTIYFCKLKCGYRYKQK